MKATMTFKVRDEKAFIPTEDKDGRLLLKPRVDGMIAPGMTLFVPLNLVSEGKYPKVPCLAVLDDSSVAHGAVIVSGPLLAWYPIKDSEDFEAGVAVKATDAMWDVPLQDLSVTCHLVKELFVKLSLKKKEPAA